MRQNEPMKFEAFTLLLEKLNVAKDTDYNFLYEIYETVLFSIDSFSKNHEHLEARLVNHVSLIYYIIAEYLYFISGKTKKEVEVLKQDEKFLSLLISNIVDKYLTNNHFDYQKGMGMSIYYPPISSLTLYLNFILGMLKRFPKNEPQTTLMNDVMTKAFTIAKCVIELLNGGFETEAFATWRTLHETECVLKILNQYGEDVQQSYLRHIKYGMAFRQGLDTKEATDEIFDEIKAKMKQQQLKSKDMKRFIEYGWLFSLDFFNMSDYKLNFRQGLQKAADLSEYHAWYEMSSEVAHSSPILVYASNQYFGYVSLINLFESFFRLEAIFAEFFMERISKQEQDNYHVMRGIHYNQLLRMYEREKQHFLKMVEEQKRKK